MLKISLLFKKFTKFTANNSRILRIKNVKFSGYCFDRIQTYSDIFTRGFALVTRAFELVTQGFELAILNFNSCF